jgi:hypothetical protein
MKKIIVSALLFGAFWILTAFNLDNAMVPREEILSGGPPKDGIPAILKPQFVDPQSAEFLLDEDQVIGVEVGGIARAYPIRILNWHEVVNDTIDDTPLVVTF